MPPDDVDEQFKLLLANTANLIAYYPELATYLRDYPNAKLASSSDLDRVRADSLGGAFGGGQAQQDGGRHGRGARGLPEEGQGE